MRGRSSLRSVAAVAAVTLLAACSGTTGTSPLLPDGSTPSTVAGDDLPDIVPGSSIPESTASEPSGAFRFFCEFSHLAYDDPILYPGQQGAAHLHYVLSAPTPTARTERCAPAARAREPAAH